jgi:hypothetical protein
MTDPRHKPTSTSPTPASPQPSLPTEPLTRFLSDAFEQYQVVGIGEVHCCVEQHQALRETLASLALIEQIDDIVVEFASATHQRLLDDYLAGNTADEASSPRPERAGSGVSVA